MRPDVIATVRRSLILLALSVPFLSGRAGAQEFTSIETDCSGLKLTDAYGVPSGTEHRYVFGGTCEVYRKGSSQNYAGHTFPAEAVVRWDANTKRLQEVFRVLGGFKYDGQVVGGQLESWYACSDDALIHPAACNGVDHKNGTGLASLSNPYVKQFRPITMGKTSLAQATSFSQKHPAGSPPPPLPPSWPATSPTSSPNPPTPKRMSSPIAVEPPAAPKSLLPLVARARVALADGREIVARSERGGLRWAILGADGELKRLFPAGSEVYRGGQGMITVNWGGGIYEAGPVKAGRLHMPEAEG